MQEHFLVDFGPFRLDERNERLWHGSEVVRLTNKALAVLRYLVEHQGQLVMKDELFTAVWPGVVVSDAALVVCIRELRQALGDERRTPQFIETVHGRGYRFIAPVVTATAPVQRFESQVPNPEEVVSGQQKEEPKAKGGNGLEPSVRSLESNRQSLASGVQSLESEEQRLLVTDQTVDSRLSDPGPQTRDNPAPARPWPSRNLAWLGVVLLASVGVFLFYFSSLRIPQSEIRNQGEETSPLPLPDKPSIIVLPFVNMSGDPSQEYFSDGVTEEITATLSRVAGLFVIARTSAFTYKGKAAKVQDISREMGVHYVLEGSVQKADGQVRITVQLIDAITGGHCGRGVTTANCATSLPCKMRSGRKS